MIPIDVKIESMLHAGFTEFQGKADIEMLTFKKINHQRI
jgi:hypothetical protein